MFCECLLQSSIEVLSFFIIIILLLPIDIRKNSLRLALASVCVGYYGVFCSCVNKSFSAFFLF